MITPTREEGHNPMRVQVTTNVTEVLSYNAIRQNAIITNNSSVTCYVGLTEGLSAINGIQLNQNDVFRIDKDNPYTGPIYAVTASGTADLRILEVSKLKEGVD
jgi:hypothetical protein